MEITINVGSNIVYVGGTVNGAITIFEQVEDTSSWIANVQQAENDTYELNLELIDEAGNHSEFVETITYNLPTFIYDRTIEDVNNKTAKGYLNATDLNRTEKNIKMLSEYFNVGIESKEWNVGDIPRTEDYYRIINSVKKLVVSYFVRKNTPVAPEQPLNTYQKWNDIEHILHDLYWVYVGNVNNMYYCGEGISSGDEIGVI